MLIKHFDLHLDFAKEKEFRIRPHSDTQLGSEDVDLELVKRDMKEAASDPLCVILGAGDILDSDRPTTRAKRVAAYAGREAELSQDDMKRMAWIRQDVLPLWLPLMKSPNRKRGFGLLGEIDGHHYELYQNGMTSTQYLMRLLREKSDVPLLGQYLGEMMCYVILHVHDIKDSKKSFEIVIHLQHGSGGSSFIGSDIGKLEKGATTYFIADVFLRGHSTKKYAALKPILYPSRSRENPQLFEKTLVMANTGGYMRGYSNGPKANYVESAGLTPVTLGKVVIHVKIKRTGSDGKNFYHPEFSVEV